MYEVSVDETFAAGHALRDYYGKCENFEPNAAHRAGRGLGLRHGVGNRHQRRNLSSVGILRLCRRGSAHNREQGIPDYRHPGIRGFVLLADVWVGPAGGADRDRYGASRGGRRSDIHPATGKIGHPPVTVKAIA